jgi:hypothetical protein
MFERETFLGIFDRNGLLYRNISHYLPFVDDFKFVRHIGFQQFFKLSMWLKNFIGKFMRYFDV